MDEKKMERLDDNDLEDVTGGRLFPLKKKSKETKKISDTPVLNGIQTTRYNPNDQTKSC